MNFKQYVETKDEKQQGLVDALILTNYDQEPGTVKVTSFDFNLSSESSIKEIEKFLV